MRGRPSHAFEDVVITLDATIVALMGRGETGVMVEGSL